jgi:hypothetical protein
MRSVWMVGCVALAFSHVQLGCAQGPCACKSPEQRVQSAQAQNAQTKRMVTSAPPRVVSIVVDQLAAWVLHRRLSDLNVAGGFHRLLGFAPRVQGGASAAGENRDFGTLTYDHALTETACGHATLYTGLAPREHGIVANERVDPKTRKRVSFLKDSRVKRVSAAGVQQASGSSIGALVGTTVADEFRAAYPKGTLVSLSLKDRGAIFAGGHSPTASLWFDADSRQFVSSTAFANTLPDWAKQEPSALGETVWEPLASARTALLQVPDDSPGEGDLEGLGTVFPHRIQGQGLAQDKAGVRFRATPYGDEALFELALRAVKTAPLEEPLMLSLSLSSNDYIGHVFGPDSREAFDELLRLDMALGAFMRALDAQFGADGYALLLTADHGVVPLPESRACITERGKVGVPAAMSGCPRTSTALVRIDQDALAERMKLIATQALGVGDWILGVSDPYVVLTDAALMLPREQRERLRNALIAALGAEPGVQSAVDPSQYTEKSCAALSDEISRLVCNSVNANVQAGLYVQVREGSFFDAEYTPGKGTSHGSAFDYDRTVPLLTKGVFASTARASSGEYAQLLRRAARLPIK